MEEHITWSQFKRLKVVKGDDWWVDHEAEPNGIGPVCLFCNRLIDWGPRDHEPACQVRKFFMFNDDDEKE